MGKPRWGTFIGGALATLVFFFTRGAKGIALTRAGLWFAGGMFAQLTLHLHCPIVHPLHILLGHTGIMVPAWIVAVVLYLRRIKSLV